MIYSTMESTKNMFNLQDGVRVVESKTTQMDEDSGDIVVQTSGGARGKFSSSKYSQSEMAQMLDDYTMIPNDKWMSLTRGQHVRYVRAQDNRFVRGGFVTGYSTQNGRNLLTLANGFNANAKGYSVWTIGLNSIKHIYVKKGKVPSKSANVVPQSKRDAVEVRKLKETVAKLKKQLAVKSKHAGT